MTHYLILALLIVLYLYSAAYCLTAALYQRDTRPRTFLRAVTPVINTITMIKDLTR